MPWDTSDRHSRLPKDWKRRVAAVMQRDGRRCAWHTDGQRCTAPATEVDHHINNDDHSLDNLRALCTPHHKAKTQIEAHATRKQRRRPTEPHPGLRRGGG